MFIGVAFEKLEFSDVMVVHIFSNPWNPLPGPVKTTHAEQKPYEFCYANFKKLLLSPKIKTILLIVSKYLPRDILIKRYYAYIIDKFCRYSLKENFSKKPAKIRENQI